MKQDAWAEFVNRTVLQRGCGAAGHNEPYVLDIAA
jgi:hypothetical protein